MSWTYADYESQSTVAARVTRLRLHMDEVAQQISASVSADGRSRSSGEIVNYLSNLQARLKELEAKPGANGVSGLGVIRILDA